MCPTDSRTIKQNVPEVKAYGRCDLRHEQKQKPSVEIIRVFPNGKGESIEDPKMEG